MSESPELITAFAAVREALEAGSFTPAERQVLALTNAVENGCRYCQALHSTFAARVGVPAESVAALRAGRAPGDPRLAALSDLARALIRERGNPSESVLQAFLGAGYTRAQVLEAVLASAFSVMANYSGHLTHAPIDEMFKSAS
jgi:AhpD family alkylhydroperoxidase